MNNYYFACWYYQAHQPLEYLESYGNSQNNLIDGHHNTVHSWEIPYYLSRKTAEGIFYSTTCV